MAGSYGPVYFVLALLECEENEHKQVGLSEPIPSPAVRIWLIIGIYLIE